jgi:hypothetical protein
MRRAEVEESKPEDAYTGKWPDKITLHLSREEALGQPGQDDPWIARPGSIGPGKKRRHAGGGQ